MSRVTYRHRSGERVVIDPATREGQRLARDSAWTAVGGAPAGRAPAGGSSAGAAGGRRPRGKARPKPTTPDVVAVPAAAGDADADGPSAGAPTEQ